jgi:hypothetical protein
MISIHKAWMPVAAVVLAFGAATAAAKTSLEVKGDQAQLMSDKAALQRYEKQMKADGATLRADTASGRMAAMSPDSESVYQDRRYIKGERKDIVADEAKLKTDRKE